MKYLDRVIQPGEIVRCWGKLHWVIYVPSATVVALSFWGFIAGAMAGGEGGAGLMVLGFVGLAFGLFLWLAAWIREVTTEIVVTDKRVLLKTGLIARRTTEINMGRVESVDVYQSILGRILAYGTVTVRGTGVALQPLRHIAGPIELRNTITAH